MKRIPVLLIFLVQGTLQLWSASPSTQLPETAVPKGNEPIKPILLILPLDARKVVLGENLFREPRLSHDNTVSCTSCHDLRKGGSDWQAHSRGINHTEGTINAPMVFNCGSNFKQFWDGRVTGLEDQIDGPLRAVAEMGSNWNEVVAKLRAIPNYVAAFQQIYSDGIQPKNIRNSIAEFERSLVTPNSRFDKFLRGDDAALSADEKEGYRKFKTYGCASCHQGVNVGGNMFETLGAMADYFAERGHVTEADYGRFNVTGKEEDRYVFKVPGLRNVALTAPYFHDGSAATLEETVTAMGKFQLGIRLSPKDVGQIVGFLNTLTDEYKGRPL